MDSAKWPQLCRPVCYTSFSMVAHPENLRAWFAADIFVSFADNVQESFGLTPIEAMAAGLPVVVSDWNGYRDSVRDGVDGFRIPTIMPPPGMGEGLAFIYAAGYAPYDTMVGGAAQITAVHLSAAANALVKLIEDPELRRRMGAAGRKRARETYDWPVIVRAYQRLWNELADGPFLRARGSTARQGPRDTPAGDGSIHPVPRIPYPVPRGQDTHRADARCRRADRPGHAAVGHRRAGALDPAG